MDIEQQVGNCLLEISRDQYSSSSFLSPFLANIPEKALVLGHGSIPESWGTQINARSGTHHVIPSLPWLSRYGPAETPK